MSSAICVRQSYLYHDSEPSGEGCISVTGCENPLVILIQSFTPRPCFVLRSIARVLGERHRSSSSRRTLGSISLLAVLGALLVFLLPPQAYAHIRPFTVRQIVRHFRAATYNQHLIPWWVRPPKGIRPQTTSARMKGNTAAVWRTIKPRSPSALVQQRHSPTTVPHPQRSRHLLDI